jgi:hypothetical protein
MPSSAADVEADADTSLTHVIVALCRSRWRLDQVNAPLNFHIRSGRLIGAGQ